MDENQVREDTDIVHAIASNQSKLQGVAVKQKGSRDPALRSTSSTQQFAKFMKGAAPSDRFHKNDSKVRLNVKSRIYH